MRTRMAIVRRYQQARGRWLQLRGRGVARGSHSGDESWALVSAASEMRALAWVLSVDPTVGLQPRYWPIEMASPEDGTLPLAGVRLTGAWRDITKSRGKRYWLLEVPANVEAGTEYWAVFLAETQVVELVRVLAQALSSAPAALVTKWLDDPRADQKSVAALRRLIADPRYADLRQQQDQQQNQQQDRQRERAGVRHDEGA